MPEELPERWPLVGQPRSKMKSLCRERGMPERAIKINNVPVSERHRNRWSQLCTDLHLESTTTAGDYGNRHYLSPSTMSRQVAVKRKFRISRATVYLLRPSMTHFDTSLGGCRFKTCPQSLYCRGCQELVLVIRNSGCYRSARWICGWGSRGIGGQGGLL